MTSNQQVILGILQGQEDPLTSKELSDISGLQQTVVLKTLGELQSTHSIAKCSVGYKLQQSQEESPLSADAQAVLKLLASEPKSRLPKTIRDLLEWPEERAKPVIRFLKNSAYLSANDQGYYYLTLIGTERMQQHCPDIELKPFVFDKIKNPGGAFKINPHSELPSQKTAPVVVAEIPETKDVKQSENDLDNHPAVRQAKAIAALLVPVEQELPLLSDVPIKMRILTELASVFGSEVKTHLTELCSFLREYSAHEKAL
jgi:hypothetical protein